MSSPYYSDAAVTLYLGDSRTVDEWRSADVLVTDPPYGVAMQPGMMSNADTPTDPLAGDDDTGVRDEILRVWGERPAIVFGSWRQPRPPRTRQLLIWHKGAAKPAWRAAPWYPAHEEIYVIGDGWLGEPEPSVYRTSTDQSGAYGLVATAGHPTPKPVGLMERLIAKCPPGVIADPFAGSGSTLIAARNLGRVSIGVEIEERYCERVAQRLSQQAFIFDQVP